MYICGKVYYLQAPTTSYVTYMRFTLVRLLSVILYMLLFHTAHIYVCYPHKKIAYRYVVTYCVHVAGESGLITFPGKLLFPRILYTTTNTWERITAYVVQGVIQLTLWDILRRVTCYSSILKIQCTPTYKNHARNKINFNAYVARALQNLFYKIYIMFFFNFIKWKLA